MLFHSDKKGLTVKLIKIIFLISIFIASSHAKEYKQILIAKTSKQTNLIAIESKLTSMKIAAYIKKMPHYYLVYSRKSQNYTLLQNYLKRIKHYFPSAIIISDVSRKTQKQIKKTSIVKYPTKVLQETNSTKMFVSVSLGLNSISGKTDNLLASKINNNNSSYAFAAGYYHNENIFLGFGYLNSFSTDIALDSLYASINYELPITDTLSVYSGVLLGVSILRLNDFKGASDSYSVLLGGQVGVEYALYKDVELFGAYQAMSINHNVALTDSSIEFSFIHNVQMGIKYNF